MVGHVDAELWPSPVADTLLASDRDAIERRGLKRLEAPLPVGSSTSWYEFHTAPVMDGEDVLGLVGAAQDVSERKAAEAAREAALEEARRLARQRSEFLAQMSHELRTPLNGILGFAQILQRDKPLSDRQARGLAVIQQSGEHLLALINDILDLARIDAAKLELEPAEVDLRGLLSVVCDIVRVKADEKQVQFACRIDERLPRAVRVDEKRLRQVLLNLLSNAVKFTDKGEVRLTVSAQAPTGPDACIRFEVQDSGIGMNEQQQARLFQPFEQVGDAKRREGGSGLGLAISRQLVGLMGGDIHVRSTPGSGSCFWFEAELPVLHEGAEPALPQALPRGYEGPRRKLLVADDVAQNRAVLVEGLAQLGFEVHEAEDGGQAVARALSLKPDLVVMDLSMPVLDGLEAMRRIHAVPGLEKLPVVVASGNASAQVQAESRRDGASGFLPKPVDLLALALDIGRLLDLRWISDAAPTIEPGEAWHDDLPMPPAEHVEELYRLVRMGHMRRICEHADRLEHVDPQYARLSQRLRALAHGCQTKGLMQLVERLRALPDAAVDS
jgi:signal transduction histidine kinase/DNA-binding NarL/FixJ family response regulator